MVVRVYKVKYELALELHSEEAERLYDFLEGHIPIVEDEPTHFYVSGGFVNDLDAEEKERDKGAIELLRKLENEEIVVVW